jgi:aminopeptidase N
MMLSVAGKGSAVESGVSEALAQERARAIHDVRYDLRFSIPAERAAPIAAEETLRFRLEAAREVVLDFAQPATKVQSIAVNERAVETVSEKGHLLLPASALRPGENTVAIRFEAGEESLNRNGDFLYALFVPARARLAFPCFDQPSLKARFTLSLDVPADWKAVANGAEAGSEALGERRRVRFAQTAPIPTYLFSFAAGKFEMETAVRKGRAFRMFHRETDTAKLARNREALFDLHASALSWLEDYTQIPYPWGKFDFVLIPAFQFGGMEHPGAIFYNANSLLLDESATQTQQLGRASTISHETAHMWFGDLVTMPWFNDVWMKEVMANLMAGKIVEPSFPAINHKLTFLLDNHPDAYSVDRTLGANPIRQPLANLDEAGSLYGTIIYQKAPVVMRQLETLLGEKPFRDGMRRYLKRYSFANAGWSDLIAILDPLTPKDLAAWSKAWVEQRARPTLQLTLDASAGRIEHLRVQQRDPLGRGLAWPQRLRIALGYEGRVEWIEGDLDSPDGEMGMARGKEAPLYVLGNGAGLGYGLFRYDDASLAYLRAHIEDVPDALARGAAWVDLWENFLDGAVPAGEMLAMAMRALPRETDQQNEEFILSTISGVYWKFLPAAERAGWAARLEPFLRTGLSRAEGSSRKGAWLAQYRAVAQSSEAMAWLARLWAREESIEGLKLSEEDEVGLAQDLAIRKAPGWEQRLKAQLDRTRNPDRKSRLEFCLPALSADDATREASFARFRLLENRRREPWVLDCLRFLNHPLREQHAQRFVPQALELLEEIRATGDIFFPTRWLAATFSGHRSPEMAKAVEDYLVSRPNLPQRLRWTVLATADNLFRAAQDRQPVRQAR